MTFFLKPIMGAVCILLGIIVFPTNTHAQWRLNVGGGGVLSDEGEGFTFGIGASRQLRGFIYINPEISYALKPIENELANRPGEEDYLVSRVNSVNFQLPFEVKFDFKSWSFSILAGPYGSRLFNVKGYRILENPHKWIRENVSPEQTTLSFWDAGLQLGGGLEKSIGNNKSLYFRAIRNIGLMDASTETGKQVYHNSFNLLVGLSLPVNFTAPED